MSTPPPSPERILIWLLVLILLVVFVILVLNVVD